MTWITINWVMIECVIVNHILEELVMFAVICLLLTLVSYANAFGITSSLRHNVFALKMNAQEKTYIMASYHIELLFNNLGVVL